MLNPAVLRLLDDMALINGVLRACLIDFEGLVHAFSHKDSVFENTELTSLAAALDEIELTGDYELVVLGYGEGHILVTIINFNFRYIVLCSSN